MEAIGIWRIDIDDNEESTGIKFKDPDTGIEVNCFDFAAQYVLIPKNEYKNMNKEERLARIHYLWWKLRLIIRTKGFLNQIIHDRTMRKINMCALDT